MSSAPASQWNPRRSRGASRRRHAPMHWRCRLSGTPAEAGVRASMLIVGYARSRSLSGTPAEAGVRAVRPCKINLCPDVSVEPPPKQGCETMRSNAAPTAIGLSGTPAEAGVRAILRHWRNTDPKGSQWNPRRSRGARCRHQRSEPGVEVSVEPPPKQGCEGDTLQARLAVDVSQWNPRRSRGARPSIWNRNGSTAPSQWNPRRSRGASI